jgi:hypothetical protein
MSFGRRLFWLADGEGFEPSVPFGTHAFQACPIDRSGTHPKRAYEFGVDSQTLQPEINAQSAMNNTGKRKATTDFVVGVPTDQPITNHPLLLTSHLAPLASGELLCDCFQLCLELGLTLVQHFELQLVAMKLDQGVINLSA